MADSPFATAIGRWVLCAIVFLVFLAVSRFWLKKSAAFVLFFFRRLQGTPWQSLFEAIAKPVSVIILSCGVCLSLSSMPLSDSFMTAFRSILTVLIDITCIGLSGWALCEIVDRVPAFRFEKVGTTEALRRMLRRLLKAVVIIFTLLGMLQAAGLNVSAIITGLGLGGLTLSLAAKDTASNLFAGLVLLVEKPFAIGDWIECGGTSGIVEDITLRSTKIRAIDNDLVIIPNSTVSSDFVTNITRRSKWMSEFRVGVLYSTPRQTLDRVIADLRGMIAADPQLDGTNSFVQFAGFSASSMDILIRFYVRSADYREYLRIRERVLLDMMDRIRADGAEFAYPSTTVYFGKGEKVPNAGNRPAEPCGMPGDGEL